MPILDRLLYDAGIDTSSFKTSSDEIKRQLESIGKAATQTFERDIQTRLAKAIDVKNFSADFQKAQQVLKNFGITSTDVLQKQLGKQMAKGFFDANKEAQGFFSSLVSGSGTLSRFGITAAGVATGALAAELVRGLAQASAAAIQFASDFELALTRVQTIAGEDFNLEAVSDEIKRLSTRIPQDVLTLTAGLTDIIGSGFDQTSEALQVLEVSSKAAVAGFTQTATAASGIVTVLNAFGRSADDAANVSDVLFKIVDEGVLSFGDLANQIGDVATPAALANISLEDLGAAIAVSTRAGINAAETMTGLKNAIIGIIAPSEGAAKAAKKLGLDFSQAGIQAAGGFNEFVALIAQATKGDLKILETLFPESRALREIAILAGSMNNEFQKLAVTFNDVAETSGVANTAFNLVNDTAQKQFELFKNNLAVAILDVGNSLLQSLEPALRGINSFLSSETEFERLAKNLERVKGATETVTFARLIDESEKAAEQARNLNDQLDSIAEGRSFASFFSGAAAAQDLNLALSGTLEIIREQGRELASNQATVVELSRTEEGRKSILAEIEASSARSNQLSEEALRFGRGASQEQIAAINKRLEQEEFVRRTLAAILDLQKRATDEDEKSRKTRRDALDLAAGGAKKEEESVKKTAKAQVGLTASTEDEAKARDKTNKKLEESKKAIDDLKKKLELLAETDDIGRRLVGIKQEADEKRKLNADNLDAIKLINRVEREERAKTIDEFGKKLREQIRERLIESAKIELQVPELITTIRKLEVKVDPKETRTISNQISRDLSDALLSTPASILLNTISNLGPLIDEELLNFVGIIDKRFADLLAGVANFAANLSSGNILGAITGAIGVIGRLFGGGDSRRAEEAQRRQQQAQEDAARAAEKATQALEELRRAAETFSAGRFIEDIKALNTEFKTITQGTKDLTTEEQKLSVQLIDRINLTKNLIASLEEEAKTTTDPERLREIQEELIKQNALLQDYEVALSELGVSISAVSAAEFERLKVILQEKGVLEDAIKRFTAFGEGLRGLIDKLQLGFDLLETTDPAEKLSELVKALTDTFAFAIPSRFQDLNEFLLAGFDALKHGGQALIDFLIEAGLEELTAEEFADLLKLLDEFQDGVGTAAEEAGDALREFLDKLQIDLNILDIDDPLAKLQFFRQAVIDTFGAIIPESFDGMKQFILQGFVALRGDAEQLKAFLASLGLEELTAEQFQELLLTLEGFLDGINETVIDVFAGLIDRLNLEFDLFNVDDPVEKMKKLLAGFVELFGFFPEGIDTVRDFIDQGFAALTAGGDVLKTFLANVGLEELTAEQLEEFLKLLDQFQDEIDKTGGTVEKVTDKFAEFSKGFGFLIDILDVTDPTEKLRLFRNAINTVFGATLPESFEEMKQFILDGFVALQGDAEALKVFLDRFGLGELTKEQFEDLLRELESGLDGLPRAFGSLIDRLNLEFKLLDIDDPLKKLDKLRKEIAKDFGAIIPETKEGIDDLINNGVAALLTGGDALKAFLASIDLEELTAEEFENFLEFLKGIADDVQKAAEQVGGAEEEIGISAIKAITFTQGNQLLNELATIREILTQELEITRTSALRDELEVEPDVVGSVDSFHTETSFYLNLIRDELATIIDLMRQGLTPATGAAALSAFDTGSLTRPQSSQMILLVKGDTVSNVSFSDLEEVDRMLIEKGLSISRSRGLV